MQRNAEVVIGGRVSLIGCERGAVVRDRVVDAAVLEQQVPQRCDRARRLRLGLERRGEFDERAVAVAPLQRHQRTLVARDGDLGAAFSRRERLRERVAGSLEPASFEMRDPAPQRPRRRRSRDQPPQAVEERHVGVLHVDVVTLFPEMFAPVIGLSILGRAIEGGLVEVRLHHLLDALEPGERADERPYGGGPGMVLRIEPLARILDGILAAAPAGERRRIVLTSATGRQFGQADAAAWAELDRLVVICGHYEGIDERLGSLYELEEISLGEFVLTGGEIAAMALLDATVRLVPGAIDADSAAADSWSQSGLDHPAYTRPASFRGVDVPPVLLSGDHGKIAAWRREESRQRAIRRARGDESAG